MRKRKVNKLLAVFACGAMFVAGWDVGFASQDTPSPLGGQEQVKDINVLKGKILGVSKKAKSISIEVGKNTEMVKFSDETMGIEHAQKDEAAIIHFTMQGADRMATVIKPKIAQLPPGVTEIQAEELKALVAKGPEEGKYFLVDARPPARFHEGSIPTAVNIPVSMMEKKGAELLPLDKDIVLIFYCGGVT